MIRFRPLIVMTIFAFIALVFLVIARPLAVGEVRTEGLPPPNEPVAEMTIASYQPVPDAIQFVHGVRPDTREQGWRVFAPVQYGDTTVFVDADFIPEITPPDAERSARAGAACASARQSAAPRCALKPPAPLTLSNRNRCAGLWFAIDLDAMGRNGGLANVADYYIASSYVGADGRATPNPFAAAPGADALPPARHLGYALTWYGLALVLIVIYFAYHASVGRFSLRPPAPRRKSDERTRTHSAAQTASASRSTRCRGSARRRSAFGNASAPDGNQPNSTVSRICSSTWRSRAQAHAMRASSPKASRTSAPS